MIENLIREQYDTVLGKTSSPSLRWTPFVRQPEPLLKV
jgi:hypothetical protein